MQCDPSRVAGEAKASRYMLHHCILTNVVRPFKVALCEAKLPRFPFNAAQRSGLTTMTFLALQIYLSIFRAGYPLMGDCLIATDAHLLY